MDVEPGIETAVRAGLADRYVIERELGRGGMATVYLARDVRHDRPVAIKVMRPEVSASLGTERFLREVRVAAQLTHPHILPLHDSGRVSGAAPGADVLYYVMPFVEGESLRDRIRREGPLPIADALRIASEVADAVAFAHTRGIVHRDIKPENILLPTHGSGGASSRHALVADFGIARVLADGTQALTSTGVSVGTPAYMSPEQASGDRSVDGRTDVYSLGCVLFEMLVGEPPFTGPNASAIVARHMTAPVPSIRTVRPSVPRDVEAVVEGALEKVPADRVGGAAEFKARIDRVLLRVAAEGAPLVERDAARHWTVPSGRWSGRWPIIAGGCAALAAFGYLAMARAGSPRSAAPTAEAPQVDRRRLVVIPFRIRGDSSAAYVADASTDDLISALARMTELRVIARSGVPPSPETRSTLEIARAVKAGSVIEGTFQQRGDSVRFEVALIDAATGEQLWNARYARRADALSGVQDSVASAVAARIAAFDHARATAGATASPRQVNGAAYDAYLHALYIARPNSGATVSSAMEDSAVRYLERALELDSGFALAHAMIANIYNTRFFNYDPNPKWEERTFVEIEKALALDPNLAEAYQEKGSILWTRANGFPHEAAAKLHRKALSLKPSLVGPHNSLGAIYMHVGLFDRALAEYDTALTLDPTTPFVAPRIARIHWYQGKYEQALREFDALSARPGGSFPDERALVLSYLGRRREALAALDSVSSLRAGRQLSDIEAARAVILAAGGEREAARRAIDHALAGGAARASHFHHAEYSIAKAYALLGERDKALGFLRRTAADGMPCYPLFRDDPYLQSLRGDPEFDRFMTELQQRFEMLAKVLE